MKQHRLAPSVLAAVTVAVAAGCAASTLESAAPTIDPASELAPADPPASVPARAETVITAPSPSVSTAPPAVTTPDPIATSTPTSSPTSTSRPAPATGVLAATVIDPCGPVGVVPDAATAIGSIELDVDGDGAADTATSYLDGGSGTWAIRLATASGTVSEYEVAGVPPGFVETLGAISFGSGPEESFLAIVGSGASALRIGLFGADDAGCIVRHGGDDLSFAVGGSIGELSGVRCGSWNGDHYVEALGAIDHDGAYNVYGTTWHLDGDGDVFAESGTHLFGAAFEDIESLATVDCDGIEI